MESKPPFLAGRKPVGKSTLANNAPHLQQEYHPVMANLVSRLVISYGGYKMKRYSITATSRHSVNWLPLLILLIVGVAAWHFVSSLVALGLAALGLLIVIWQSRQGKKRVGDYVEVLETGILFCEAGQSSCIAYSEIKEVQQRKLFGPPAYIISTSVGNKKHLQPDDFEDGARLREQLAERFQKLGKM